MRLIGIVALVGMLAGCAAFGSPQSVWKDMTAEQIKAAVSDKSASVVCVNGTYAGALINTVAINVDRGTPSNLSVDAGCKVTFGSVLPSATQVVVQPNSVSVPIEVPRMTLTPAK